MLSTINELDVLTDGVPLMWFVVRKQRSIITSVFDNEIYRKTTYNVGLCKENPAVSRFAKKEIPLPNIHISEITPT
jgi:hypothetical protein